MKKTVIILQARTGSKRYPNKVLAKIEGKSMIWHIINRLKKVKNAEKIIIYFLSIWERAICSAYSAIPIWVFV